MINNNFKTALLIPMLLFILGISSCNKDNAIQQETKDNVQIETLQKFLAEQMQLDPSSIVFNQESQKFQLPGESGEYTFEFDYDSVLETYNRDRNQSSQ